MSGEEDGDEVPELTEEKLAKFIGMTIDDAGCIFDEFLGTSLDEFVSYEEAGLLTRDAGFVLKFNNGREFQVTVKRSR